MDEEYSECRTCAMQLKKSNMESVLRSSTIADMLSTVFSTAQAQDKRLPEFICLPCLTKLNSAHDFVSKANHVHKNYLDMLSKEEMKEDQVVKNVPELKSVETEKVVDTDKSEEPNDQPQLKLKPLSALMKQPNSLAMTFNMCPKCNNQFCCSAETFQKHKEVCCTDRLTKQVLILQKNGTARKVVMRHLVPEQGKGQSEPPAKKLRLTPLTKIISEPRQKDTTQANQPSPMLRLPNAPPVRFVAPSQAFSTQSTTAQNPIKIAFKTTSSPSTSTITNRSFNLGSSVASTSGVRLPNPPQPFVACPPRPPHLSVVYPSKPQTPVVTCPSRPPQPSVVNRPSAPPPPTSQSQRVLLVNPQTCLTSTASIPSPQAEKGAVTTGLLLKLPRFTSPNQASMTSSPLPTPKPVAPLQPVGKEVEVIQESKSTPASSTMSKTLNVQALRSLWSNPDLMNCDLFASEERTKSLLRSGVNSLCVCVECRIIFLSHTEYLEHFVYDAELKAHVHSAWGCRACKANFGTKQLLKEHYLIGLHGNLREQHTCSLCPIFSNNKKSVMRHMLKVHSHCPHCYTNQHEARRAALLAGREPPKSRSCPKCGLLINRCAEIALKRCSEVPEDKKLVLCNCCCMACGTIAELITHLNKSHPEIDVEGLASGVVTCSKKVCNVTDLHKKNKLLPSVGNKAEFDGQKVKEKESKVIWYCCSLCSHRYRKFSDLLKHTTVNHSFPFYNCRCGRNFSGVFSANHYCNKDDYFQLKLVRLEDQLD